MITKYIFYQIIMCLFGEGRMNITDHSQDAHKIDQYILGNRNPHPDYSLHIGRFYALDGSLGSSVHIDVSKPHVVVIAGKRGYGKSYTLGVLLEEFSRLPNATKKRFSCVVIDTLGIFWTLQYPNEKQQHLLCQWKNSAEETPIRLLTPSIENSFIYHHASSVNKLQLPPHILTIHQWCELFQCSLMDEEGILLSTSILSLQKKKPHFSLQDIIHEIKKTTEGENKTKQKVISFLNRAISWQLFSSSAKPYSSIIKPGEITIIDLSSMKSTHLKQSITGIISDLLFHYRVTKRKEEELKQITNQQETEKSPYIWLAIDEAHLFLPEKENSYVKQVLLQNWLRQGRQPGLSILLATQRPGFMDTEVLSHCDLLLCHRLTAYEDIQSLTRLRPIYMKGNIQETIKKIGTEKGVALLIDDVIETTHIVKIRPRYSWHGGGEPESKSISDLELIDDGK